MGRHVMRAVLAAVVTAAVFLPSVLISFFFRVGGVWSPRHWPRALQLFTQSISWLCDLSIFPAMLILSVLGDRSGTDGAPGWSETIVVIFVLWWIALELGSSAWKRLMKRRPRVDNA
jgi:hypothetical protein